MASKNLSTTLKTIAQQWPLDKLRPTLQFSGALKSANDRTFSISPSTSGNGKEVDTSGGAGKVEGERVLSEKEAKKAEEMINSLNRILANDALKSVCLSSFLLSSFCFFTDSLFSCI